MKPALARAKAADKKRLARVAAYRQARAVLAIAAAAEWDAGHPPSYHKIVVTLGLDRDVADLADEIRNDANGPDEGQETEERALERCCDLLRMESKP